MNAVITGGSKGIGKAIADVFLENGLNVAICSRNQDDLDALKESYKTSYPDQEVLTYACDLSLKSDTLDFAKYVSDNWETIDILVNNAGVFIPGEISKEEDGILEKLIETNLYSAYHITRALLPKLLKSKPSHIINICSIASKIAYPNGGSYSISKFALLGFSKVLREELKDKNVKVVSVLPGATWSNSWAGAVLPESRIMQARDIALPIWNSIQLSDSAVVEEIILRPQLGDL